MLLIIAGSLLANGPEVKLTVNDGHYYIGDRIKMDLQIRGSEKQIFALPDVTAYLKNVMVLDIQKDESIKKHNKLINLHLELTAFDTGFIHIPPMPVVSTDSTGFGRPDTIYTPEKYVYVYSILDSTSAPVAMNPPLPLGLMTWWEYLIALALLILAVALLIIGLKFKSAKKVIEEDIWESPKEKAEHYLQELEKKHYPEKEQWKIFYLELTYIARDYFENIYFVHLKELTTTELIPALKEHVPNEYQDRLRELFQFADLVKFAKGVADQKQCKDHFDLIKEIVDLDDIKDKDDTDTQVPAS